jgi:hypothetical protein
MTEGEKRVNSRCEGSPGRNKFQDRKKNKRTIITLTINEFADDLEMKALSTIAFPKVFTTPTHLLRCPQVKFFYS